MQPTEIRDHLRRQIVADVHLGKLKPGGRLPSLRMVSTELGISIRAAARAYSDLQDEGLVSVRGRSGIYLVLPPSQELELHPPLDWYTEFLAGAWVRRLRIADVASLLSELIARPMSVACVESTLDHMEAFCTELADEFSLQTHSITLTPDGAKLGDGIMTLYDALTGVDFVVTTAFHAAEVRAAADLLKKPVVIVSANDVLVDAIQAQVDVGRVIIVAHDPLFIERFNNTIKNRFADAHNLRVLDIAEAKADPALLANATVLYTRAARKEMNEAEYHLLPPPIPFLSVAAARRVLQCMLATHAKRALQIA